MQVFSGWLFPSLHPTPTYKCCNLGLTIKPQIYGMKRHMHTCNSIALLNPNIFEWPFHIMVYYHSLPNIYNLFLFLGCRNWKVKQWTHKTDIC